ncbi:hypothetical protein LINGRAHAP2_LOCUS1717, partial [Linum grandiflorum]
GWTAGNSFCRAPISAEATALLSAVQLAGHSTQPTLILCDCATLIASLTENSSCWPWECASLIAAITHLLNNFHWVDIRFSPRSGIQAADAIAKKARLGTLEPHWLSNL